MLLRQFFLTIPAELEAAAVIDGAGYWPLAIGIVMLKGSAVDGRDTTHLMMAMSTVMVLPIIIIFFFAQRVVVQGIALTGLKG